MRDVGPLNWAPGLPHGKPLAVDLAEVLRDRAGRAVLLDQRLHDVVHRRELIRVSSTIQLPSTRMS